MPFAPKRIIVIDDPSRYGERYAEGRGSYLDPFKEKGIQIDAFSTAYALETAARRFGPYAIGLVLLDSRFGNFDSPGAVGTWPDAIKALDNLGANQPDSALQIPVMPFSDDGVENKIMAEGLVAMEYPALLPEDRGALDLRKADIARWAVRELTAIQQLQA